MKRSAYDIVREKRAAEGPPEVPEAADDFNAPFKGWYTRGDLPHCDKPGLMQMITYRLADSMPAARRHEWESFGDIDDARERRTRIEDYLDSGHGDCHLRGPQIAALVENGWRHFDGQRYRLLAWVVMPNHVHLLYEAWLVPMPDLLDSWKSYTAREANKLIGRTGVFWQDGYLDTFIRDEAHFHRATRYIENNPVTAGLARSAEEWPWSSANLKWEWSGQGRVARYHGAHLMHPNWATAGGAAFQAVRSSGNKEGTR